jgi:plasmid stabilization system protein ParE
LSTFPFGGREREEIRSGLRSYVVHPYVVFYRVNDRSRVVAIVRVIHAHRDIDTGDFEET